MVASGFSLSMHNIWRRFKLGAEIAGISPLSATSSVAFQCHTFFTIKPVANRRTNQRYFASTQSQHCDDDAQTANTPRERVAHWVSHSISFIFFPSLSLLLTLLIWIKYCESDAAHTHTHHHVTYYTFHLFVPSYLTKRGIERIWKYGECVCVCCADVNGKSMGRNKQKYYGGCGVCAPAHRHTHTHAHEPVARMSS